MRLARARSPLRITISTGSEAPITSSGQWAQKAMIVGGLLAAVTYIPFTITHGPTSYNLENAVAGWDMHRWGMVMGSIPQLLVGAGLWRLREAVAGGRRVAVGSLTIMCLAMFLFAATNLIAQAIAPPLDLFILAPASAIAATTTARRDATRALLAALAVAYAGAVTLALIPLQTSDRFGGYRIFGLIAYAGVGALWAALGAVLLTRDRAPGAT